MEDSVLLEILKEMQKKGQENWNPESPISEKVIEKGKNIQQILKRTIEIDKFISTRIAGTHSFYN